MRLFGIEFSKKAREKQEILKAYEVVKMMAAQQLSPEWAAQMLSSIRLMNGVPQIDYDLANFINEGYVKNPHVYSVVSKITGPASQVPWIVYKIKDKVAAKRYQAFKAEGRHREAEGFEKKAFEVVTGSDLNKIFEDEANPLQTWPEFVEASIGYFCLTGNDFIFMESPVGMWPTALYNLPAQIVEIIPGDFREPVKGYQISMANAKQPISADKVIHRKMFNPTFKHGIATSDYLYGMSPMAPLCRVVQRSNESIDASLALMLNGFPPGILSQDISASEGNPAKTEDIDKMQDQWRQHRGGGKRANQLIISSMKLDWLALGLKSADMELLESDKVALEQVAGVYNVPLPLVSLTASTRDNYKTAERQLWEKAIVPHLNKLRESLNKGPVKMFNKAKGVEYWVDFDLKAVPALQEDLKEKADILINELEHGIITPNQYLYAMDKEIDEANQWLNKFMLKSGLRYMDEPLPSNQQNNSNPPKDEQEETAA